MRRERSQAASGRAVLELGPPPPPDCGAKRGPRAKTRCELPPGHAEAHFGRDRAGRWQTWPNAARGES